MSENEPESASPPRRGRRFPFRLGTLPAVATLIAVLCSLFFWQVMRAERQERCVRAIQNRGGYVEYDYQLKEDGFDWTAQSPVPEYLLNWLGKDFFHRVAGVEMDVLLPPDWEWHRELAVFNEGCLVPGNSEPSNWERYGSEGPRKLIWPTTTRLTAEDWARAALRQRKFGCDRVTIDVEYCRNALKLDPHNIEANLLLGESPQLLHEEQASAYLDTVIAYSDPESLEHAQAKKRLSREPWTWKELRDRVGADGVLR